MEGQFIHLACLGEVRIRVSYANAWEKFQSLTTPSLDSSCFPLRNFIFVCSTFIFSPIVTSTTIRLCTSDWAPVPSPRWAGTRMHLITWPESVQFPDVMVYSVVLWLCLWKPQHARLKLCRAYGFPPGRLKLAGITVCCSVNRPLYLFSINYSLTRFPLTTQLTAFLCSRRSRLTAHEALCAAKGHHK